jgi:hypothetical protein
MPLKQNLSELKNIACKDDKSYFAKQEPPLPVIYFSTYHLIIEMIINKKNYLKIDFDLNFI